MGLMIRESLTYGSVYFFLALINLRLKLILTDDYFNGSLESNHELLMKFQYINNEQSRLFQFLIPESFHNLLGFTIREAYILQRGLFIFLVFLAFHLYLRHWFRAGGAFSGVLFLAAIMPLSYFNDLQESTPLLLLTFLLGLWAIREEETIGFMVALALGSLNNETMLFLPGVYFLFHFRGFARSALLGLVSRTAMVALPGFLVVGLIRYHNRHLPVVAAFEELEVSPWVENTTQLMSQLSLPFIYYWWGGFLSFLFLFGAFWIFSFRKMADKPRFVRRSMWIVPIFVWLHFMMAEVDEVRLFLPLAFVIIPSALFFLMPMDGVIQDGENHDGDDSSPAKPETISGTASGSSGVGSSSLSDSG
ncbi:MAG: hypothetical protein HQL52_10520 [Magnetococcales bacterium]|nr:hypothetical protein [Magnetococcales bacterium]